MHRLDQQIVLQAGKTAMLLCLLFKISHIYVYTTEKLEPPAGLEPAIPGLGGRCLIHWATEAIDIFPPKT